MHKDTGLYPKDLNQLVPRYLKRMPFCALRLTDRRYRYIYNEKNHFLIWTKVPPFGRHVYCFKTGNP